VLRSLSYVPFQYCMHIRRIFKINHLPIEGSFGCVGVAVFVGGLGVVVVVVVGVDSGNDDRNQTNKLPVYENYVGQLQVQYLLTAFNI